MSAVDKTKNTAQDLTGKAKEAAARSPTTKSYRPGERPTIGIGIVAAYFTAEA